MDLPIHCYFGNEVHMMTSWTNLNLGRRLLGCQNYMIILCLFIKKFQIYPWWFCRHIFRFGTEVWRLWILHVV